LKHIGRISHSPSEEWVALSTNTDTPMPDFNKPVIDPDKEVLNTSQHILDHEDRKCYRPTISRPNAHLWHSAIEAEIDALWCYHTSHVVDRPTNINSVDSKCIFEN
jgi:hypothetical protein